MDNRPAELLVPPATRLIHIGPHKTGSTAVQLALTEVRPHLADYGVHYAGDKRRPRLAGWSIGLPGRPSGSPLPPESHWDELVAEVEAAGDLRVCISNEDFGRAGPLQRARIVGDLGGERAHVVAAARRLDSYLPSQWQERVKAGVTLSWEDWLRVVLDREAEGFQFERANVWRAHDIGGLIRRWSEIVDPDRMTIIVSDDRDRELLPRTFEGLLGLPSGLLQPDPNRSNTSLSWAEVEALRATHAALTAAGVSRRGREPVMSGAMRKMRTANAAAAGPSKPPFPAWAADQLRELGEERAEAVRSANVRVVGSPDSLLASPQMPVGDPSDLSPADQAVYATSLGALEAATAAGLPELATGPGTDEDPTADDA